MIGSTLLDFSTLGTWAAFVVALIALTSIAYIFRGGLSKRASDLKEELLQDYERKVTTLKDELANERAESNARIALLQGELEAERRHSTEQDKALRHLEQLVQGVQAIQGLSDQLRETEARLVKVIGGKQ